MAKRATPHDGQLMLRLYDLRREPEMRKARNWFLADFWPRNADDVLKVIHAFASQENNWFRQVGGYWDMAAALVLQGALHEELFLQPGCSGEMFLVFTKMRPHLKELRQKLNNPDYWGNIEEVATGSKLARKRLARVSSIVEQVRATLTKPKK